MMMKWHEGQARFSEDRRYRYMLYRRWSEGSRAVLFICLNPSTADEDTDDATVTRCISFAKRLDFPRMFVGNIFAFRATNPAELLKAEEPVGPDNDIWLRNMVLLQGVSQVVAAWGNHGAYRDRSSEVVKLMYEIGALVTCFGVTKAGEPKHPLYLPADAELELYQVWSDEL